MSRLTFAWLALPLLSSLAWCDEPVQRAQALEVLQADEDGPIGIEIRGEPVAPAPARPGGEKPADKPEKPEEVVEPDRTPTEPVDPLFLRLHLGDGSLLAGKLSVKEITVTTEFGKLVIPIEKIKSFEPGLESSPGQLEKLQKQIEDLGSDDYKTRESAHKQLAGLGSRIRLELERYGSSDNAEIKRHVSELMKAMEEEAEGADEESSAPRPWLRQDTIATREFTVVGTIDPKQFDIQSKYGKLTVAIADIKVADRPQGTRESLNRSLTVAGDNIAQRNFKSSGIRVQAGDRIIVKADGTMVMTPWGSNSIVTPDGAANYGWYVPNEIPGGALVARIGDKGSVVKVGKQSSFIAKNSGILQFAVGVQGDYAGDGYQYPGQYKLKIRVEPK